MDVEIDECESKKIETETVLEEPPSRKPLTEENLRLHQGSPAMSQPKKSRNGGDPAETLNTKISIETRQLLRINHLFMDERKAFDRYPEIKAKCEEILTRERDTEMTEEEQERILL